MKIGNTNFIFEIKFTFINNLLFTSTSLINMFLNWCVMMALYEPKHVAQLRRTIRHCQHSSSDSRSRLMYLIVYTSQEEVLP
jgi:hypothetical protein